MYNPPLSFYAARQVFGLPRLQLYKYRAMINLDSGSQVMTPLQGGLNDMTEMVTECSKISNCICMTGLKRFL